jgi:hypothetical protein
LFDVGEIDLQTAVDVLQATSRIGDDDAQAIMAEAFRPVRGRELYLRIPHPAPAIRRRDVPQSTLDAADYVCRQGDTDALRRWLDEHRTYLSGILDHWRRRDGR